MYKKLLMVLIALIFGIILYFVLEVLIGEVVTARGAEQKKGNDEMFPFYWLIFIVGGSIASTLSYVSWRKYRGEQKEKMSKDNDKSID